jgi:hypothetical protein
MIVAAAKALFLKPLAVAAAIVAISMAAVSGEVFSAWLG